MAIKVKNKLKTRVISRPLLQAIVDKAAESDPKVRVPNTFASLLLLSLSENDPQKLDSNVAEGKALIGRADYERDEDNSRRIQKDADHILLYTSGLYTAAEMNPIDDDVKIAESTAQAKLATVQNLVGRMLNTTVSTDEAKKWVQTIDEVYQKVQGRNEFETERKMNAEIQKFHEKRNFRNEVEMGNMRPGDDAISKLQSQMGNLRKINQKKTAAVSPAKKDGVTEDILREHKEAAENKAAQEEAKRKATADADKAAKTAQSKTASVAILKNIFDASHPRQNPTASRSNPPSPTESKSPPAASKPATPNSAATAAIRGTPLNPASKPTGNQSPTSSNVVFVQPRNQDTPAPAEAKGTFTATRLSSPGRIQIQTSAISTAIPGIAQWVQQNNRGYSADMVTTTLRNAELHLKILAGRLDNSRSGITAQSMTTDLTETMRPLFNLKNTHVRAVEERKQIAQAIMAKITEIAGPNQNDANTQAFTNAAAAIAAEITDANIEMKIQNVNMAAKLSDPSKITPEEITNGIAAIIALEDVALEGKDLKKLNDAKAGIIANALLVVPVVSGNQSLLNSLIAIIPSVAQTIASPEVISHIALVEEFRNKIEAQSLTINQIDESADVVEVLENARKSAIELKALHVEHIALLEESSVLIGTNPNNDNLKQAAVILNESGELLVFLEGTVEEVINDIESKQQEEENKRKADEDAAKAEAEAKAKADADAAALAAAKAKTMALQTHTVNVETFEAKVDTHRAPAAGRTIEQINQEQGELNALLVEEQNLAQANEDLLNNDPDPAELLQLQQLQKRIAVVRPFIISRIEELNMLEETVNNELAAQQEARNAELAKDRKVEEHFLKVENFATTVPEQIAILQNNIQPNSTPEQIQQALSALLVQLDQFDEQLLVFGEENNDLLVNENNVARIAKLAAANRYMEDTADFIVELVNNTKNVQQEQEDLQALLTKIAEIKTGLDDVENNKIPACTAEADVATKITKANEALVLLTELEAKKAALQTDIDKIHLPQNQTLISTEINNITARIEASRKNLQDMINAAQNDLTNNAQALAEAFTKKTADLLQKITLLDTSPSPILDFDTMNANLIAEIKTLTGERELLMQQLIQIAPNEIDTLLGPANLNLRNCEIQLKALAERELAFQLKALVTDIKNQHTEVSTLDRDIDGKPNAVTAEITDFETRLTSLNAKQDMLQHTLNNLQTKVAVSVVDPKTMAILREAEAGLPPIKVILDNIPNKLQQLKTKAAAAPASTAAPTARKIPYLKKLPDPPYKVDNAYQATTDIEQIFNAVDKLVLNRSKTQSIQTLISNFKDEIAQLRETSDTNIVKREALIEKWNTKLYPLLAQTQTHIEMLSHYQQTLATQKATAANDISNQMRAGTLKPQDGNLALMKLNNDFKFRGEKVQAALDQYKPLRESLYGQLDPNSTLPTAIPGSKGIRSLLEESINKHGLDSILLADKTVTSFNIKTIQRTAGESEESFQKKVDTELQSFFVDTSQEPALGVSSVGGIANLATEVAIMRINGYPSGHPYADSVDPLDSSVRTIYTIEKSPETRLINVAIRALREDMDPLAIRQAVFTSDDALRLKVKGKDLDDFFKRYSENPPTEKGLEKFLKQEVDAHRCSLGRWRECGTKASELYNNYLGQLRHPDNKDLPHPKTVDLTLKIMKNFIDGSGGQQQLELRGTNVELIRTSKLMCEVLKRLDMNPNSNWIYNYSEPMGRANETFSNSTIEATLKLMKQADPDFIRKIELSNASYKLEKKGTIDITTNKLEEAEIQSRNTMRPGGGSASV